MTPAYTRGRPFCIRGSCGRKQCFRAVPCRRSFCGRRCPFCFFTDECPLSAGGIQWTKRSPAGKTQRSNMPAAFLPARHSAAVRAAFWPRAASCARSLPAAHSWRPCFIPRAPWQSARSWQTCPASTTLWRITWPTSWPMWAPIRECSAYSAPRCTAWTR